MAFPTDPYDFTDGTTADADEVNARFDALYAVLVAGGLDAEVLASQAWTAYTPSWTNVTLGTSPTNTGRSMKLGRTVLAQGILTLGTSGDVTGNPTMTLPYAATTSLNQMGVARFIDSSASLVVAGYVVADASTPTVANFYAPGTQVITDASPDPVTVLTPHAVLGASHPCDWAAGDSIRWALTYEAAS